ncbi:hypothetical protein [Microtetraspora malaysiensis]|uniref:Uncharacterized protein n=1 Tax=Microtetraspora malaysiensis TaxID=161358 RepID=A0ABW6SQC1_9ACTN
MLYGLAGPYSTPPGASLRGSRVITELAIRQARERHPALDGLLIDTADSNRYMRAINHRLGYAPTHQAYGLANRSDLQGKRRGDRRPRADRSAPSGRFVYS